MAQYTAINIVGLYIPQFFQCEKFLKSSEVQLTVLNRNLEPPEINRCDLKVRCFLLFSFLMILNEVINNLGHSLLM